MMEIKQTLEMPAAAFFDKIMESVLFDIKKQTGHAIKREQLPNFSYQKHFGHAGNATLKVTELVPNESYHFQTESSRGAYNSSYDILSLTDEKIQVIYKENSQTDNTVQRYNDMIMGFVLGFARKRSFKKMLKEIEKTYQA